MTPLELRMRTDSMSLSPLRVQRLGIVMESDPVDPREAEGVLNPAVTRGPDGQHYLLPRLVASDNYSLSGASCMGHGVRGVGG